MGARCCEDVVSVGGGWTVLFVVDGWSGLLVTDFGDVVVVVFSNMATSMPLLGIPDIIAAIYP